MVWALLLVFAGVFILLALSAGGKTVPWMRQLYRMQNMTDPRGEWMAPENIAAQVVKDYLTATNWLQASMLDDWERCWAAAPSFLGGGYLRRYQSLLVAYRTGTAPRFVGVLRADHQVIVRHFSDDGARCLVVDQQDHRRMATYNVYTHERVMTQDLGSRAVVYQMAYDAKLRRWKIEEFVQELPSGWERHAVSSTIKVVQHIPPTAGRDN